MGCLKLSILENQGASCELKKYTDKKELTLNKTILKHQSAYIYGYQGSEKTDEIKGKGNSVNYEFRMHDPRVGRFLSLDPLSNKYPHNSPYAFSENSTIAFIELEGLERYFAADGSYLGAHGSSSEIRVVNNSEVESAKSALLNPLEVSASYFYRQLNNNSQSFDKYYNASNKSNLRVASNILTTIYTDVAGKNNLQDGYVKIVNSQTGGAVYGDLPVGASDFLYRNAFGNHINKIGFFAINQDGHISMNQFIMENNYFELAITLYHESLHSDGIPGGAWGEFDAHNKAAQHSLFDKTSEEFQRMNLESMSNNLSKQRDALTDNANGKLQKRYEKNKKSYEKEKKRFDEKFSKKD